MSSEGYQSIGTLPQFERLVRPLSDLERIKLKMELLESTDDRIIRTWRGKHLLDRQKYELCMELNLSFSISEQFFEDWMAAAEFICREQLKTPELTEKYRKYLIGQMLNYALKRKHVDPDKTERKMDTADTLGREWNLTGGTISKYGFFADAVNDIYAHSEEMARIVLSEKVNVSHENVIELSHLKGNEIRSIAKTIEQENIGKVTLGFIRNEVKMCHIQERGSVTRKEKEERELAQHAGIRQMPKYDPDAEVNSLCLTIESWISSIQRVRNSENFVKISEKASLNLMKKLSALEYNINGVQESLVERTKL